MNLHISKYIFFLLLSSIFSTFTFAQKGYKTDTIIYKKQGEPYWLIPNWLVDKTDTFNFTRIDRIVRNGDTIADKKLQSVIIHTVEKINDTAIIQTARIGKEIYQQQVFYKGMIPQNPRIKDFYIVKYQTDRKGTNIKILNCEDLQKHLIPDLQTTIDSVKKMKNENLYLFSDYPVQMKECKNVQSFLTGDLEMFHQLYNQLVPINDTLKYQIKMTDTADSKRQISVYLKVGLTEMPNGNKIFELSEDKDKGATVFENLAADIEDILKKVDDAIGADDEDFAAQMEDKTTIEVDVNHYPVNIRRLNYSIEKTKKGQTIDLFEYKIEKR